MLQRFDLLGWKKSILRNQCRCRYCIISCSCISLTHLLANHTLNGKEAKVLTGDQVVSSGDRRKWIGTPIYNDMPGSNFLPLKKLKLMEKMYSFSHDRRLTAINKSFRHKISFFNWLLLILESFRVQFDHNKKKVESRKPRNVNIYKKFLVQEIRKLWVCLACNPQSLHFQHYFIFWTSLGTVIIAGSISWDTPGASWHHKAEQQGILGPLHGSAGPIKQKLSTSSS